MTLVEEADPQVEEAAQPRRVLRRGWAALPWLLALAVLVAAWYVGDVSRADIARYLAYWLFCLLLPGTLVHRALLGSRGNLAEDLGYGAATGLVLELGAWASAAALGQQHVLRWWPAPVVLLFLAVPRLRRHWRVSGNTALPLGWHWAMAGVVIVILASVALRWPEIPLPPAAHPYYPDYLYHLALVHELTRSMPFEVPQMVGEPLRYHFLSDAHIASASMITGSSPAVVLLRLWVLPVAVVAVVVTAGLARDLTARWWAGPVGAAVAYLGVPVALGAAMVDGANALVLASPSQIYLLPLFVVLAGFCVAVVRGQSLGPGWALVPAFGLACAGAKMSSLPPLVCGLVLAGVASAWLRRRVPWATIAVLASLLVSMALGYWLFAGGGAGTLRVQIFALLRWYPPYNQTLGADDGAAVGTLVPPGLAGADAASWYFACGIVAWWLLMQAPRFVGMLVLAGKRGRADPAAWLLSGVLVAGTVATWMLYHPGASQYYFYRGVLPFGALLGTWLVAATRPPWPVPVVGGIAGVIAYLTVPAMARPTATRNAWTEALAWSAVRLLAFALGAALLGIGVAAVLRWLSPEDVGRIGMRRALSVAASAMTAAFLAASVAGGVDGTIRLGIGDRYAALAFDRSPPVPADQARLVLSQEELTAALWLDAHAAAADVVATNVHCRPPRNVPNCDARAFWVAGVGGRRTVIESWGYTGAAHKAQGRDGHSYVQQPAPDPERYALNERIFTAPTRPDLDRLRREYGVRWLFADNRAGPVSPALAELAEVKLVSGPVTVFELR